MRSADADIRPNSYAARDFYPPPPGPRLPSPYHQGPFSAHLCNFQCRHDTAASRENIQRLAHRANFAESAFYAILDSHSPKEEAVPVNTHKIDGLVQRVGALAEQSFAMSQSLKISGESLSQKIDESVLAMGASQATFGQRAQLAQDAMKLSVNNLRIELRGGRKKLSEDIQAEMQAARENLQYEKARERLARCDAELAEVKEAMRQARSEHANADRLNRLLKRNISSLENQVSEKKEETKAIPGAQTLNQSLQAALFAVDQMIGGQYDPEDWLSNAPEHLASVYFDNDLISLGRKLSDALKEQAIISHCDFGSAEPEAFSDSLQNAEDHISLDGSFVVEDPQLPPSPELQALILPTLKQNPNEIEERSNGPNCQALAALPAVPSDTDETCPELSSVSPLVASVEAPTSSNHEGPNPTPSTGARLKRRGLTAIAISGTKPNATTKKPVLTKNEPRLTFKAGEVITNVAMWPGLWFGTNASGEQGWFQHKKVQLR